MKTSRLRALQACDRVAISRRNFLAAASVGMMGVALSARAIAQDAPAFPAIDAHAHFYDPSRPQGVPWPGKQDNLLYRTVLPPELKTLTQNLGVRSAIAVEASPWPQDNQWLLDLAARDRFIAGVVGNLDPAADSFPAQFASLSRDPLFRGIRVNHDAVRTNLGNKTFLANLRLMIDHDRALDLNGGPALPADVARLAALLPNLRIVINHCANVPIDGKTPPAEWRQGMEASAAAKNVFCKVSALVEGAPHKQGPAPADLDFYRPVLDTVWKLFGEDRLIYASNWPVCLNAASYAAVHNIVNTYFREKGDAAAGKFFLANAVAAYKLVDRGG